MLYLDLALNDDDFLSEEEKKCTSLIRKIKIFVRKNITKIFDYEIDGKNVLVLAKINKSIYKKLKKIFLIDVTKNVCISDELYLNNEFREFLNGQRINLLDGRWLFKYLCLDIIKYIVLNKNEKIEEQEISVLVNKNDELITGIIKELSESVHNINIITKDIRIFQKLKNDIYNENGMILNVSNNYKKSGMRSKIILNFDFNEEDLEKVNFLRKAVIVNLKESIKLGKKSFDGIICNFYYISFSYKRYEKFRKKLNHFNKTTLYESFIYKQTYYKNIFNEIKNDEVKIEFLEGIRGNIKHIELKKLCNI